MFNRIKLLELLVTVNLLNIKLQNRQVQNNLNS